MRLLPMFALAVFAAAGGDLSGIWTGQAPGRNGEIEDVTFEFQQDGSALNGKAYGESEDVPITEGKIEGDRIRFSVVLRFGSNTTRLLYTGEIIGDEIRVTRQRERAGEKQGAPQNFTLKRMT